MKWGVYVSSEKTSNLNLHRWTGSDQVLRTEFNENFHTLDSLVGGLAITDVVDIQLRDGIQLLDVKHPSTLENVRIKGRTLANLLGRDGNCKNIEKWALYSGAMLSLDPVKKMSGLNSIQFKIASGQNSAGITKLCTVSAGKYYIALADIANTDLQSGVVLKFGTEQTIGYTGTSFATKWVKFAPTASGQQSLLVFGSGAPDQAANVDSVRVYEVTAEEFTEVDGMTPEQIAAKWPYVDDMKSINAPYIVKYGENLLPPFNEWTSKDNTFQTAMTSAYSISIHAVANDNFIHCDIPVVAGQTYTYSVVNGGKINCHTLDANKNSLSASGWLTTSSITITAEPDAAYVRVFCGNDVLGAGEYTFSNPMLALGSTAKPFQPRSDDMLLFPNVQLASSVDGAVYDQLFKHDGKYQVMHQFKKEIVLDGSLDWDHYADFTGYKTIHTSLASLAAPVACSERVVKYDGTILTPSAPITAANQSQIMANGSFFVTIPDTESGWGEDYPPSPQEIQAYFNGWKMFLQGSDPATSVYNRSGTRMWVNRKSDGTVGSIQTSTLPTQAHTTNYQPYKLTYQLAVPEFEELPCETGLSFHHGMNQIEVGTGIIVREKANPKPNGAWYEINSNGNYGTSHSELTNRARKIWTVYKNSRVDGKWAFSNDASCHGNARLFITKASYDPKATYEVTYQALEPYALSVPVQQVDGAYAGNIGTAVDVLVSNQASIDARLSAVEIRKSYASDTIESADKRFVSDAEKAAWNSKASTDSPVFTGGVTIAGNLSLTGNKALNMGGGGYLLDRSNEVDQSTVLGAKNNQFNVVTQDGANTLTSFKNGSFDFWNNNASAPNMAANDSLLQVRNKNVNAQVMAWQNKGVRIGSRFKEKGAAAGTKGDVYFTVNDNIKMTLLEEPYIDVANDTYLRFSATDGMKIIFADYDRVGSVARWRLDMDSGTMAFKIPDVDVGERRWGFRTLNNQGGIQKWVFTIYNDGCWESPNQSRLYAVKNGNTPNIPVSADTWTKIIFNHKIADTQGEYNPNTGEFTAKRAGTYLVSSMVEFSDFPGRCKARYSIWVNNNLGVTLYDGRPGDAFIGLSGTVPIYLNAGDVMHLRVMIEAGSATTWTDSVQNYLSIVKIG
ncbi:hypothetical protein Elgi_08010 [Paenibacillus elgii]|nr:hypothetical protein Elgi_08010 [Paenibacillus elgii]